MRVFKNYIDAVIRIEITSTEEVDDCLLDFVAGELEFYQPENDHNRIVFKEGDQECQVTDIEWTQTDYNITHS